MTDFFVPSLGSSESKDQETTYAALAASIGQSVPPLAERIYSMKFEHDGVEWVATVGEKMRGTRWVTRRVKGQSREIAERQSGSETVVAIFAGSPYMVWLDTRPLTDRRSAWANPFMATDSPRSLIYFASDAEESESSNGQ